MKVLKKVTLGFMMCLLFLTVRQTAWAYSSGESYTLNNPVPAYNDSWSAASGSNPTATYLAGNYYVYKVSTPTGSREIINITRTKGSPGAWINPTDNKLPTTPKPVPKPVVNEVKYQVIKSVNLRTGPSTSYSIIRLVAPGTIATYLGESSGTWLKLNVGGLTCWSSSGWWTKLTVNSTNPPVVSSYGVMKEWVSLRKTKSTSASRYGIIDGGVRIPVLANDGTWITTTHNNNTGYILAKYVAIEGVVTPKPVTDTAGISIPQSVYGKSTTRMDWSHQSPNSAVRNYSGEYDDNSNNIYLTFDSGFENDGRPYNGGYSPFSYSYNGLTVNVKPYMPLSTEILKVLKAHNIKAVFFLTGQYLDQYEQRDSSGNPIYTNVDIIRQALADGHIIGCHTYNHTDVNTLTPEQIKTDIVKWEKRLKTILGYLPVQKYFRFPSGVYSYQSLATIDALGYKTLFWGAAAGTDYDTENQPSVSSIRQWLTSSTDGGDIPLLHTVSTSDLKYLDEYIDWISARGYKFSLPK